MSKQAHDKRQKRYHRKSNDRRLGSRIRLVLAMAQVSGLNPIEAHLFHAFHAKSKLMNGSIPPKPLRLKFPIPTPTVVQVLPSSEIESRKRIALRLPRQAKHFGDLLDHFLNVKDSQELHLALRAHFGRLSRYFEHLQSKAK